MVELFGHVREKRPLSWMHTARAFPAHLCHPESAQTSLRAFQENLHDGPSLATATDSSRRCELGRAGPRGVRSVGLVLPPGWCSMEGCAPFREDDIFEWCGRGTQHRDLGGCPSSPLPRATQPNLPLYDSSSLWDTFPLLEPGVSG